MRARTKNSSNKSEYGMFGLINVFGFFYSSLDLPLSEKHNRRALKKENNVLRKIFHSWLGENKMKLGKSRWIIVTLTFQLK